MKKTKKIHNNILALDAKIVDEAIPLNNLELKGKQMQGKDWGNFGIDLLEVYPPDLYMTKSELAIYNSDPGRDKMFAMYNLKDWEVRLEEVTCKQKPFSGWGKIVDENGQVKRLIRYKNGKKDGLETFVNNNGLKKVEITNKDSKRVYEVKWYENGQKRAEQNWKDGKKNGLATYWYENGQKESQRTFKDGKKNGLWTNWFENGQKKSETNYKNGQKSSERNYKNGKFHGLSTDWFENGQKRAEQNWKDGKLNGLWTEWHENGLRSMELTEKEGELDGLWTEWYENGRKKWEINRNDKKLISAESWKPNGEKCPVTNVKNGNGVVVLYKEDGTEKIHLNEDQLDKLSCSQDRQARLCKEFSVQNNTQGEGKIGTFLTQKLELLQGILHNTFRKLKRVGIAGIVIGYD